MNKKILKRLQEDEFSILEEFDKVCKKHKIKYSLAYGSALGAVRHKGFIPWDDDIDVTMTVENYKKFAEVAPKELSDKMFFQSLDTENYMYLFWNKIRKNNTFSAMTGQEHFPIHLGICMDIFPLSKYPLDKKIQNRHYKYMKYAWILLRTNLYEWKFYEPSGKNKIIYKFLSFIPVTTRKFFASKLINKVFNYEGDYTHYVNYVDIFNKLILFPKEMVEETEMVEFEGKQFPIFKKHDEYLTILYGDYMKLPPKSEQKAHGDLTIKFEEDFTK